MKRLIKDVTHTFYCGTYFHWPELWVTNHTERCQKCDVTGSDFFLSKNTITSRLFCHTPHTPSVTEEHMRGGREREEPPQPLIRRRKWHHDRILKPWKQCNAQINSQTHSTNQNKATEQRRLISDTSCRPTCYPSMPICHIPVYIRRVPSLCTSGAQTRRPTRHEIDINNDISWPPRLITQTHGKGVF